MSSFISFPVAIVGVACRLPGGVRSLDDLWSVLSRGCDAVTEVPLSRWDTSRLKHPRRDMPGRSVTVSAGIVEDIYDFDPFFFGISRTEAEAMDPQQRLLLELTWEALEDAGIPPSSLSGSDTAVYVGAASPDAGTSHADDICATTPYSMTGTNLSIISNRISYIYNFHGPSMTIDTACSSAMHALHQACMTLASGGAGMAVAGGVNVLLSPYPFVGFSQAHMLSPEGRCKVFDAAGDGYVRAEGGGIVILEPLDSALAQGHDIRGVIRGIAVNSDGRTQGIALPSEAAQEALLSGLYEATGISPERLAYMEAHGTGTAVGDPIETAAIGRALGQRRDTPLWVGSVKCNLGHLETASAMAGLMKALLILRERKIPPQIHLNNINPAIDTAGLNLRFPLKTEELPEVSGLPLIGINSFGFGGSNGHLIVEAAPSEAGKQDCQTSEMPPLFLSARSEESLRKLAGAYAAEIEARPESFRDLAAGAVFRRDLLSRRLVTAGETPETVAAALRIYAEDADAASPETVSGEAVPSSDKPVKTAFVFSGNGGQWAGMGRDMMKNPAFAARTREIAALLKPLSGQDILEIMNTATPDDMARTDVAQQLLFTVQAGLCAALDAAGIRADAAFGHSVGEVAAAWYAGAVSLPEAARIIYYRSKHQESTAGAGRMAAASISPEEARELLTDFPGVELAGINAADAVTLSGNAAALEKLGAALKARRIFFKLLPLNYAFHSSAMDPVHEDLLKDLGDLKTQAPARCFISSVTGKEHHDGCPASYWWENVRKPVLFREAEQTAITLGVRHFLEIGPHSILLRYLRSGLDRADAADGGAIEGWVGGTLSRMSGAEQFQSSWKNAWVHGWPLDLKACFAGPGKARDLPRYPWNNQDCRLAPTPECQGFVGNSGDHPLLGRRLSRQKVWENVIDPESFPWLRDHKIGNTVYYPAAAFLEMALAAAKNADPDEKKPALLNTAILRPVILREREPVVLRTVIDDTDGEIRIMSRGYMRDEPWTLNARGRIVSSGIRAMTCKDAGNPAGFGRPVAADKVYALTEKANMAYGPVFRPLDSCWQNSSEILARFQPPVTPNPAWENGMLIPPPLLDGGLQLLFPLIPDLIEEFPAPRMPCWFDRCVLTRPGRPAFALARRVRASVRTVVCDLYLLDENGRELFRLEGGQARAVEQLKAPAPSSYATFAVPAPHPQNAEADGRAAITELAETIRIQAQDLARDSDFRRFCDEILPLREMTALTLAKELRDGNAGFRFAELAVHLEEYLSSRDAAFTDSLPSFADIWNTLMAESPESSAANLLLSNAHRILLGDEAAPLPEDHPLRAEYRRQEYRHDGELAAYALEEYLAGTASAVSVLEIDADDSSLARLMSPALRRHQRILAGKNENAEKNLRLLLEGAGAASRDAPLETLKWDPETAESPVKAHALVACHCLHEADDIPLTLKRCHNALHSNGLFILAENAPNIIDDLLWGQHDSWWISDPDRSGAVSRLMTPEEWHRALENAGFADIQEIRPDPAAPGFILLARASCKNAPAVPEHTSGSGALWLLCTGDPAPDNINDLLSDLDLQARKRGDSVIRLTSGAELLLQGDGWQSRPESRDHWKTIFKNLAGRGKPIICVFALTPGGDGLDIAASENHVSALTELVRGWTLAGSPAAKLRILTLNALSCPEDGASRIKPGEAAVIGAARVIMNEMPALETLCADLHFREADPDLNRRVISGAVRELLSPAEEREVIIAPENRYVLRSRSLDSGSAGSRGGNLTLEALTPGRLETLRWIPGPLPVPGRGQVRVAVRATGLNFRDVMWAMNMLPEEALENGFSGPGLGIECAGVVDAVGDGVTAVAPGDRVLAFGPRCFAGYALTEEHALTPLPEEWSFADAATVPVAFFTAWYAIKHLARMEPGERILIHGAAGGVGLAAIQIAASLGLEVYATAGNPDKRHMLKLLGINHVYNSRSLSFHDEILADTVGEGVDAVLNSLAGEGMDQSFRLLRPFGRFLELGKRDFYADNDLRLRPFRNNISFFGVDVDQFIKEKPLQGQRIFREIMAYFHSGEWHPLPYSLYSSGEAEQAFRAMQQSRHTGKIVIAPPASVRESGDTQAGSALPVSPEGSYIVSGGLGGFGLETARRLAARGAGALILLSRRGPVPENAAALEELASLGLPEGQKRQIIALAQDVTCYDTLAENLDRALAGLPPLRGVIHAAAVLDDGMITAMTPERISRSLRPKLGGAFNLHRFTQDKKLDFFVMYSSATTLMGNPGQANYVAANMGLESLAALRRSLGLPGLAVGWGAIGDAGMLTRDRRALDSLERVTGIVPLTAAGALDALEKLPASGEPAPAVFMADWKQLSRLPAGKLPRLSPLRTADDGDSDAETSLADIVKNLPAEKARIRITEIVTAAVARIMRVPASEIKIATPLADLGMDSLMAVELLAALEERLGGRSLMGSLSAGSSIRDIAARIQALLEDGQNETGDIRTALETSHSIAINDALAGKVMKEVEKQ